MNTPKAIKLLLISDLSLATHLERSNLQQLGIRAVVSQDIGAALEQIKKQRIQVVMVNLDYLGLENTRTFCAHLRAHSQLLHFPLVVNSAQVDHQTQELLHQAGANLVIEQPLPKHYLITLLKKLLKLETRQSERSKSFVYFKAALNNGTRTYPLTIADISLRGMLAEVDEALTTDKLCQIAITVTNTSRPLLVTGKVTRIHAAPQGQKNKNEQKFLIGINFQSFAGKDEELLHKYLEKYLSEESNMLYYL